MRLAIITASAVLLALMLAPAGCEKSDENLYKSAERLLEKSKYDEAVNKLTFLVAEYPDSKWASKAYFLLGQINYFYYKKPEAALDSFVHAAEREKKSQMGLEAQINIADIYLNRLNNPELAILQYQKIIKEYAGSINQDEYQFLIGKAYFTKSDYKQAIIEFSGLLEKHRDSQYAPDALYHMGLCHFISGEPQKAADVYSEVIKKYHHGKYDYDSRLGLGMCYEEMEQLQKALETYRRMEKQYPDNALVKKKIEALAARLEKGKKE